MGKVDVKIENEALDRINIHADMYETISEIKYEDNLELEYKIKGFLYEFLIDSLLHGYKEVTIEEIKSKLGDTCDVVLVKAITRSLKRGVIETRRSRITGKQKKIEITQPSECLPEGLEE